MSAAAAMLKYPSRYDRCAARRIHAIPAPWSVTALCGAGVVMWAAARFDPAHVDACPACAERVRTGAGPAR